MNCPKCGYENKEGADHCDLCKEILRKELSEDNTSEDSASKNAINPTLSCEEQDKKPLFKINITYIVIALLVIIGLVLFRTAVFKLIIWLYFVSLFFPLPVVCFFILCWIIYVQKGDGRYNNYLQKWNRAYKILPILMVFPIIPGMSLVLSEIIYPKLIIIVLIPYWLLSMYKLRKSLWRSLLIIIFLAPTIFISIIHSTISHPISFMSLSPGYKNILTLYKKIGMDRDGRIRAEGAISYFPVFPNDLGVLPKEAEYMNFIEGVNVIWSKDGRFVSIWNKNALIWGADFKGDRNDKYGRRLYLNREAYLVNAPNNIAINKVDFIKWLIKTGYNGDDFIEDAIDKDDLDSVVDIISASVGVDTNMRNGRSETPLIIAVKKENKDAVLLLLQNGADKSLRDKDGKTALDYAQHRGYTEIVEILSEKTIDTKRNIHD